MRNFLLNFINMVFVNTVVEVIFIIITMNTKYNLVHFWYIPVIVGIICCAFDTYIDNKREKIKNGRK